MAPRSARQWGELSRWRGTLVRDEYKAYDSLIGAAPERFPAGKPGA
jgi:hypothetical protein